MLIRDIVCDIRLMIVSALAITRGQTLTREGAGYEAFAQIWKECFPDKIVPNIRWVQGRLRRPMVGLLERGIPTPFHWNESYAELWVECIILGVLARNQTIYRIEEIKLIEFVWNKMKALGIDQYIDAPKEYIRMRLNKYKVNREDAIIYPRKFEFTSASEKAILDVCRWLQKNSIAENKQDCNNEKREEQNGVRLNPKEEKMTQKMLEQVIVDVIVDAICCNNEGAVYQEVEQYKPCFMQIGHEIFPDMAESKLERCFTQLIRPQSRTQDANVALLLNGGIEKLKDPDSVFAVVVTRALNYALACFPEKEKIWLRGKKIEQLVEMAATQCRDFGLEGMTDERLNRELKAIIEKRYALYRFGISPEITQLLQKLNPQRQLEILDFYLEQNSRREEERCEEIENRIQAVHAEYDDIREKTIYTVKQNLLQHLSSVENDTLGWLYEVAKGKDYSDETLRYMLRGLLRELEEFGITPTEEKVGEYVRGGRSDTRHIRDVFGAELVDDEAYRIVKIGWRIDSKLAVFPAAEHVIQEEENTQQADEAQDDWMDTSLVGLGEEC